MRSAFPVIKSATVAIVAMEPDNLNRVPFQIFGSGFCIDPQGIIVTCRHVVSSFLSRPLEESIPRDGNQHALQMKRLFAIFYAPTAAPENLAAIVTPVDQVIARQDIDTALLRVTRHKLFPSGYPVVEAADPSELGEGDEIGCYGFPLGNRLFAQLGTVTSSLTCGRISAIVPSNFSPVEHVVGYQLDLTATNGNSGGPVFLQKSQKVFGILQAGPTGHDNRAIAGLARAEALHLAMNSDDIKIIKEAPTNGSLPSLG